MRGALQSGGQNCAGAERFIVAAPLFDDFTARVVATVRKLRQVFYRFVPRSDAPCPQPLPGITFIDLMVHWPSMSMFMTCAPDASSCGAGAATEWGDSGLWRDVHARRCRANTGACG